MQTAIAKRVTNRLNENYGVHIDIKRIKITPLLGTIALKEVYVEDHKNDTLLYLERLNTTVLSVKNIVNGTFRLGRTTLQGLRLHLKTYRGETDTNLDIFIAKLEGDTTTVSEKPFLLKASRIHLLRSEFTLVDENEKEPEILHFTKVQARVADFKIEGSAVFAGIENLSLRWKNGLILNHLTTQFSYTPSKMAFEGLCMETANGSAVNATMVFEYERQHLAYFVDKVHLKANFLNTILSLNDVNLFYDAFGRDKTVAFSSNVEGTLNTLKIKKLELESGNTHFKGDVALHGFFTKNEAYSVETYIAGLATSYADLNSLMPRLLGKSLPASLLKLGLFRMRGHAVIMPDEVDTALEIETALGAGSVDGNITRIRTIDRAAYKGFVSFRDFSMGKLIGDENLGEITLAVEVDGEGFTPETLHTEVIGTIDKLAYHNYNYTAIQVSGLLKDQLFDGSLVVNDPNFKFDFKGLADFSQEVNEFNFRASVEYANLYKLNLVSRDTLSLFKGEVSMNMKANSIDDAVGTISFLKTTYTNQNDTYYFDDFSITASMQGEERLLEINSPDIITGYVKGKFYINELGKLVQNSVGSMYTNYSPYKISPHQYIEFNGSIYNKIVEVFYPSVNFGANTYIKGSMKADNGDFKLTFKSPQINIKDNVIQEVNVQVDNKNPLFNTYVEIGEIVTKNYRISDFNLINTKIKDTLFFRTECKGGQDKSDAYNLNFYHTLNKDKKSVVGIKTSDLTFKGNKWLLNRDNDGKNRVIFSNALDTIDIQDIVMTHNEERIDLGGKLIDSTYKNIRLQFKNVSLQNITPAIDSLSLDGLVNGGVNLLQTNGNYLPTANLVIENFKVNNTPLGILKTSILGKDNLKRYAVNINLENDAVESLAIVGDITVDKGDPNLHLQGSFQNLNLEILNLLKNEAISDIRGTLSGNVTCNGKLNNPNMEGRLFLENAGMKIPYLNVDLRFRETARVNVNKQTFFFDNIPLVDTHYNTQSFFKGSITHTQFKRWYLDCTLDTRGKNFLALNTPETEEALYYGTGFINGSARIRGYTDRLNIQVNGATGPGTSIKIPISEVSSIGDASFINFIDKNEKNESLKRAQARTYEGLEMEFDLDVTPDAEAEIVVDKRSGSTLRGTGAGNLLIEINTNGKFNMWGDFITYTGTYNFKYGGVIDKKFRVLPGGTINWEGDPYNAAINMRAVYSLYANPAILLDNSEFARKVATEVEIKLDGNLEQIEPDFEIKFPGMNSVTNSELQYKLEEKDKRQLQALSLLSQGAFVREVSISQQALTGNLFETASGLVNEILNDDDGKFDVGISLEKGGRNPNADIQVEDRLGVTITTQINERILVNGKIGVPVGGVTETIVAGNVEVKILLNEDGTLSAKIFNKENEIQQFLADRLGYTQGVGLSYQVEFDTLRELFRKIFKKSPSKPAKKKKEPQETPGEGIINFSDKRKKDK